MSTEVAQGALRLTRRGRLVVRLGGLLVMLAVVTMGVLLGGGRALGGERVEHPVVTYHVIEPGDTLWDLAVQVAPDRDPRDTVLQIVELNGLPSAEVGVGARLALPVTT